MAAVVEKVWQNDCASRVSKCVEGDARPRPSQQAEAKQAEAEAALAAIDPAAAAAKRQLQQLQEKAKARKLFDELDVNGAPVAWFCF
jgi:hypothetical protein